MIIEAMAVDNTGQTTQEPMFTLIALTYTPITPILMKEMHMVLHLEIIQVLFFFLTLGFVCFLVTTYVKLIIKLFSFFSYSEGVFTTGKPQVTELKYGNAAGLYDNRNYGIIRKVEHVEQDGYHYL